MKKKLYVFDLDGVLIDSKDNMKKSWSTVQEVFKIENTFEEYFSHIGIPFTDILHKMGIDNDQYKIKTVYDRTSHANLSEIKFYKDAKETLAELRSRGCRTAIVTSKSWDRTERIIQDLPSFDYVGCPNSEFRGKPAPDHLFAVMAHCNVDREETVYIGDMEADKECAERAGVDFIFAEYGYGELECNQKIKNLKSLV
jgi:HAD superfamily hydrolase (TIGR01549 family)